MSPISYSGEGRTDAILAQRLIVAAGGTPEHNYVVGRSNHGKAALDRSLHGLVIAARHGHRLLVLRDLDHDAPCAASLVRRLTPELPPGFCLRIAVRAAEAWILADRDAVARALGVERAKVPDDPEALSNPKKVLRELASAARNREAKRLLLGIRQQMQGWVSEFVADRWNPHDAARNAPSLDRALKQIRKLAEG